VKTIVVSIRGAKKCDEVSGIRRINKGIWGDSARIWEKALNDLAGGAGKEVSLEKQNLGPKVRTSTSIRGTKHLGAVKSDSLWVMEATPRRYSLGKKSGAKRARTNESLVERLQILQTNTVRKGKKHGYEKRGGKRRSE